VTTEGMGLARRRGRVGVLVRRRLFGGKLVTLFEREEVLVVVNL
jgi:hypothetical protein